MRCLLSNNLIHSACSSLFRGGRGAATLSTRARASITRARLSLFSLLAVTLFFDTSNSDLWLHAALALMRRLVTVRCDRLDVGRCDYDYEDGRA